MDVDKEVGMVVEMMKRMCKKQGDGSLGVPFGEFFYDPEVESTFESLVGTLKAAKRRGLINFPGQMLLMPTHKDVLLTLLSK